MVAISLAETFRLNLRKALAEKGLTQKDLAKLSGVGRVHICRILSGKHEPTLGICEALARGIRLPPEQLMARDTRK